MKRLVLAVMKRLVLAVMSAAILIGLLALSAAAVDQGVAAIFGGVVEIGDSVWSCDKNVDESADYAPTGRGIGLPGIDKGDKDFKYRLGALGMPAVVLDQDNGLPSFALGDLWICGNIGAVGGQPPFPEMGPWCGMHKGYNGQGKIKFTDIVTPPGKAPKVHWANLSDVAWKFAVGATPGSTRHTLPILGKVRVQNTNPDDSKGPKGNKWGTLIALVSVLPLPDFFPGPSCFDPTAPGTQVFRFEGVAAIINSGGGKDDVYTWKDNPDGDKDRQDSPIFCKGSYDADNNGSKESNCPIYQRKPKPTKPKDNA